jgi:hypothetical protein
MASPIDDSGDGACYAELFEPAHKIEQLLRDGFMQGSSPGVAAAYNDARGKHMLFKAVAKATMFRLLQAERRMLSG